MKAQGNTNVTKVKICGLTREEDVEASVSAGADAIGLVFVSGSRRNLSIPQARELIHRVPAFVTVVGLFLDASNEFVSQVLAEVPIDLIQFHGRESADFCAQFNQRYIKAVSVENISSVAVAENQYSGSAALLLDSHSPGQLGGTGEVFDWSRIRPADEPMTSKPLILAGGLNPENVASAVREIRPWGVDVSSGVESSPGKKDAGKIRRFVAAAKSVI